MKRSLPSRDQTPVFILGVAALLGSLGVYLAGGSFEWIATSLTLLSGWYCFELLRSAKSLAASNRSLQQEIVERRVAEEALRASEERFRLLTENSLDLIARLSMGGHFLDVSSAAETTLGYSADELVGTHPSDLLHPDDKEKFWKALQEVQRSPQRCVLTVRMRSKSGEYRWIEISAHSLANRPEDVGGEIHCTLRDITVRREEERRRDQMTRGLRAIMEVADELLRFSDERQLLRHCVEMARERLGLVRCGIFLASEDGFMVRGTFGTDGKGATIDENRHHIGYATHWRECVFGAAVNTRWRLMEDEPLEYYIDGVRQELPTRGWISVTLLSSGHQDLGFLSYDPGESGEQFDPVKQELVGVYASMVGAMLARTRADAAKRAVERQLRAVVESAPIILYAVDRDERYFLAAGKGLARLGYEPSDLIGKKLDEVSSDATALEDVRRALAGETNSTLIQVGGVWMDMLRQPSLDDDGVINGMLAVGIDVTEQHLAESARLESELQYRQVVDNASEVFFQLDAQGRWILLNPAWTDIMGYSLTESLGRPFLDFVHPDDRETVSANMASLLARERQSCRHVVRFVARNGSIRSMDTMARLLAEVGENLGVASGTLNDITERLKTEEKLLSTTALQNAILNGSVYAIIATLPDGTIQHFNRAAEEMLGYKSYEMVGRHTPALIHDPEEVAVYAKRLSEEFGQTIEPGFEALVARARRGQMDEREWTYLRKDGRRIPVRLSVSALADSGGNITGFLSIAYDLSESKRVESLKNEFVSVVSHELRTPLTSIRGALGLLAGGVAGVLPTAAVNMIEIARKNSERLVLLINDILDIEKIESGKTRFVTGQVNVRHLVQSALEANQYYAESLGVTLVLETSDEALLNGFVEGDEDRLMQVLANLISNACKFTPEGETVRVKVETGQPGEAGNTVRFAVQDQGPGVPEEFLPRLFEKFAQADASSTRQQGGTGLGLAIARAIIEKHGGFINYEPPGQGPAGGGSTFLFELPHFAPSLAALGAPDERPTVLICEDDSEMADLLSSVLDEDGHATEIVTSIAAAVAALKRRKYAGMTLDLMLPDGDGLELLQLVRSNPATESLPVVIVSVSKGPADELVGQAVEVVDWLRKPIDPSRLLSAVRLFAISERKSPCLLHVEDDEDVRQVTAAIIGDTAEIKTASSLKEAKSMLETQHFDLVILDIGLPDGSGLDLLPIINARTPPIPVILFSARDVDALETRLVAASLMKSRTSNAGLLTAIQRLLH